LEVSEEVAKAATLEVSEEMVEEVTEEAAEEFFLVAVVKGANLEVSGEVSEGESDVSFTQEQVIERFVIKEKSRQEKKSATVAWPPTQDIDQIMRELKECHHLLIGKMEEDQEEDMSNLAMLTQFEREKYWIIITNIIKHIRKWKSCRRKKRQELKELPSLKGEEKEGRARTKKGFPGCVICNFVECL
jgi:hypothetical protein